MSERRGGPGYEAVENHVRQVHGPAFGRPHALAELDTTGDGAHVVVTGAVLDELIGTPRTALYDCRDGRLRALTDGEGAARGAQFSPDGETLAFLSDQRRSGVFQLHLLAVRRLGEAAAMPAAAVPGTVEYLRWSSDGARILLGVADLGADLASGHGSGTVVRDGGESGGDWRPLVDDGNDDDARRSLWMFTVSTGESTLLSPDSMNCWEAAWCGTDHVIAVSSPGASEDDWYDADLNLIDVRDRTARAVLRNDGAQLGLPAGSPDGRWIAVVRAVCSDRWLVAGDLLLVDRDGGDPVRIDCRGTDVTSVQWIDDSRLGYIGQRHLDSVAGILDVATRQCSELLVTERSCSGTGFYPTGAFTQDGRLLTIQDAYDLPPQVVLTDHGEERVLVSVAHPGTDYQRSIAGDARSISWTAPDGLEIEGILCAPADDGPHPLVVNIHGGPVWAFRNAWSMGKDWVPLLVSQGYAVLNPNPRGSSGRGQEFARRVVGDLGGADTHDILSGIDALVEQGVADPERIGLIGGSYGGYMSAWLVTQDQRFAAAVPIAPVTDWYSQSFTSSIARWGASFLRADPEVPGSRTHSRSPVLQASRVTTPCLNVAGALDRCTPAGQAEEFHRALLAHGVQSRLVIYPQEGHGIRLYPAVIDLLGRVLDWFDRHMAPDTVARTEHR